MRRGRGLLNDVAKELDVQPYLNELLSISRINALKFFVYLGQGILKSCGEENLPEGERISLNKNRLIDTVEESARWGDKLTIPDDLGEKFLDVIGKIVRRVYLATESNAGLSACEKMKIGNFMVEIFETVDFYQNENFSQHLLDLNYIKQKNVEFEKMCREESKPIEATYDPAFKEEFIKVAKAWEELGVIEDENGVKGIAPEKNKAITVAQEIISPLVEILSMYFSDKDKSSLKALLEGKSPHKKLLFQSSGNRLVAVLFKLKEAKKIVENKTEINGWICDNFCYRNSKNKEIKDFDKEYVRKILTGQRIITKNSRIDLEKLKLSK